MSFPKKTKHVLTSPDLENPTPQRPQTLFQHLSSGLSSIIPRLVRRKSTPRHSPAQHQKTTAPNEHRTASEATIASSAQHSNSPQTWPPKILIPTLSEPDGPYQPPYPTQPRSPYPSPSAEHTRCGFCGLRHSSKPLPTRPWSEAGSSNLFSHATLNLRRSRNESRNSHPAQGDLTRLLESSLPAEECPRLVSAAAAAARKGNPPRRASLPGLRLHGARRLHSRGMQLVPERPVTVGAVGSTPNTGSAEDGDGKLKVPNFHYMHGLPNAKEYPYVHRGDVERHMDALRSGAASPLVLGDEPRDGSGDAVMGGTDYSETVFYGEPVTSTFTSAGRRSRNRCTQQNTLDLELESSGVYQRHSPPPRSQVGPAQLRNAVPRPGSESTFGSIDSTGTPKVGGKRLELKGGSSQSAESRLRGGNGRERIPVPNCCFRLKKALPLTRSSHTPSKDAVSNARLPVAHTANPAHVPRAKDTTTISQGLPITLTCSLRGGAGSPPTALQNTHRLPPTLYMLSGGTEKRPVTVASWKKQRPERRVGGLLGMAIYGGKAGVEYMKEGRNTTAEQDKAAGGSLKGSKKRASSSGTRSRSNSVNAGAAAGVGQEPLADAGAGAGAGASAV